MMRTEANYDLSAQLKAEHPMNFKELLKRNMAGEELERRYYFVRLDRRCDDERIYEGAFPIEMPYDGVEVRSHIIDYYRIHEAARVVEITWCGYRGFTKDGKPRARLSGYVLKNWWGELMAYNEAVNLGKYILRQKKKKLNCACL